MTGYAHKPQIYIDGQEGTTGLQIYDRLGARDDLTLLRIDPDKRKDDVERRRLINAADLVFLCLPDAAAKEAVAMIAPDNTHTRMIDASTAHRTAPGWTYGFAELSAMHREQIKTARYTANPGCHATGFIAAVYPLVQMGLLQKNAALTAFSLTGYSGGGKKMIAEYEAADKPKLYDAPRLYGLSQTHKHLPEMQKVCGLLQPPVFCPVVDDYYSGMAVTVMLDSSIMAGSPDAAQVRAALLGWYEGQALVSVDPAEPESVLSAGLFAGTDLLKLFVGGGKERITVTAVFDNLGKGASGAAVQNMNLMLGLSETEGLKFRVGA